MKVESLSEPLVECWIARVEAIEQRALIKLLGTSQVSIRPVSREFLELEHFDGLNARDPAFNEWLAQALRSRQGVFLCWQPCPTGIPLACVVGGGGRPDDSDAD